MKYFKTLQWCAFLLCSTHAYTQTLSLEGTIKDSASAETLPYASLQFIDTKYAAQANAYGHFSLRAPAGSYQLLITYLGYHSKMVAIKLSTNQLKNFDLSSATETLDEVEINASDMVQDIVAGRNKINVVNVQKQASFAGEPDLLKALQFLPGVKSPSEATTNLSVRGGSYDQTLILLDGAPVYNPSHALGFFSTFNTDAIKDVALYKGLIPAQYGNRLSSVVDIRMRDGNVNKYQTKIGIGLIASRFTTEGPIKKGLSSFIVSGRYSYAGAVVNGLGSLLQNVFQVYSAQDFTSNNKVSFYDLNAKVNLGSKSGKDHVYISGYTGGDTFNYYILQGTTLMNWGNQTASLQWNHLFNNHLFMTASTTYSNYGYHYQVLNDSRRFDWSAGQREVNTRAEFNYTVSPAHSINFGIQITRNNNRQGSIKPLDTLAVIRSFSLPQKQSILTALFVENTWNPNANLKIYAGLRQGIFSLLGPGIVYKYGADGMRSVTDSSVYSKGRNIKTFSLPEPRIGLTWLVSSSNSFKVSFNQTVQYTHLLSNSSVGLPTDIWTPSGPDLKPQTARQLSLGYYTTSKNRQYGLTVEGYYKKMSHVIDFIDNADLFLSKDIAELVKNGSGLAYGLEFMLDKTSGQLRYQFSYTWAKTTRTIQGINNNNPYPTRDDRRHALAVTGLYALSGKRVEFSANFVINSGAPITFPSQTFLYHGALFYAYDGRNQYRLPIYHRLDLSLILKNRPRSNRESSWIFSIYNVYDKKNIFSAVAKTQEYGAFQVYKIAGLAAFGIVPSISYTLILK